MRRVAPLIVALLVAGEARATRFEELAYALSPRMERWWSASGLLRVRAAMFYNLDLDRGPTPSGQLLFPVPLSDPRGQTLTHADMRLRTDLGLNTLGGGLAVRVRLDVLDNLVLGSLPDGPPTATGSQRSPDSVLKVRRAYGMALTPLGVLAAGRMGNHFGLGMLANAGDCDDCDSGDAADRIAWVVPTLGHIFAFAFDFTASGPLGSRRGGTEVVDVDPTDDTRTVTVAILRVLQDRARDRRTRAGKTVVEYGAVVSYRWQEDDVPLQYLPAAQPGPLSAAQSVARGFSLTAVDGWLRVTHPWFRAELEAAVLVGKVDQPSLIPGVALRSPLDLLQWGLALQTDVGPPGGHWSVGIDAGVASGDPAPGFGVHVGPTSAAARPGDLAGPQSTPPYDMRVEAFRFHSDYRVDRILFREIIGTVMDAAYIRPHATWRIARLGPGTLALDLALIASFAMEPSSTPSGARPLGVEIDPSLRYGSRDGFSVAVDYAVLFPLEGLDNPVLGLRAKSAQLLRLRLGYGF